MKGVNSCNNLVLDQWHLILHYIILYLQCLHVKTGQNIDKIKPRLYHFCVFCIRFDFYRAQKYTNREVFNYYPFKYNIPACLKWILALMG